MKGSRPSGKLLDPSHGITSILINNFRVGVHLFDHQPRSTALSSGLDAAFLTTSGAITNNVNKKPSCFFSIVRPDPGLPEKLMCHMETRTEKITKSFQLPPDLLALALVNLVIEVLLASCVTVHLTS
jgi:hypothetical protein